VPLDEIFCLVEESLALQVRLIAMLLLWMYMLAFRIYKVSFAASLDAVA
jgi:hypothetical protein